MKWLAFWRRDRRIADLFEDVQRALADGRVDRARRGCADIIQRFAASRDPEARTVVAQALYVRATAQPKDLDEEMALYTTILEHFDTDETVLMRYCVALTLYNKALRLSQLGLPLASFRAYTQLIGRFRSAPELDIQFQVAKALVNRGGILSDQGHASEELADYEEVIARLHSVPYLDIQRQVAFALCNKSNALDRCGRFPEAEEARATLFALFGSNNDRGIQTAVATALEGRPATAGRHSSRIH